MLEFTSSTTHRLGTRPPTARGWAQLDIVWCKYAVLAEIATFE
jgi:hypothetical protein